jgi:hypothetical protein
MKLKTKALIGGLVTVIGLFSAVVGLWDRFFPPVEDNKILLLEKNKNDLHISKGSDRPDTNYLQVNHILVDGDRFTIKDSGLLIANKITMINGGEIYGKDIHIVATIIDNGRITSSESIGNNGGNIFIVSAQINGTEIVSNGKDGKNGANGKNGSRGSAGSNGRNGNCASFGRWRSAHAGGEGKNGGNGSNGSNGESGGNAGSVTILTSYALTSTPESKGGSPGKGGKGGAAGLGGKGGRGGRGCTGLGGVQNTQPSGADGNDGVPGKDGQDGKHGSDKTPIVKLIDFSLVKDAFEEDGDEKDKFISRLRQIRSKK